MPGGVTPDSTGWRGRCPAHNGESKTSLHVSEGEDGRALLFCHAGCSYRDVLAALGLDSSQKNTARSWEIRDAAGVLHAVHHRKDKGDGEKVVWWRGPNGEKKLKDAGIRPADLPLYGVHDLNGDGWVVVVEGEPAADALKAAGIPAVATVTGASSTPSPEVLGALAGRKVTLWPDADEPGRSHMESIAAELNGKALEVRWYECSHAASGDDAADHRIVADRKTDAATQMLSEAPVHEPKTAPPLASPYSNNGSGGAREGADEGSARPRLTSARFEDIPDPGPRKYLLEGLIPEGYPVMLHGDGGVAKSLLAMSLGMALANGGKWLGHETGEPAGVMYLDFELDAAEQRRRVNRLVRGARMEKPPELLRYMSALGYPARAAFAAALEECREHGTKLLILDSLGPALAGDAEASRDVIGFYQNVLEPFRAAGISTLIIDHQSRLQGGESYQAKSAFGSVFKTNLARSVIQAEATGREENALTVRLRQKKHNFGPMLDPFEVKLKFSEEDVYLERQEVSAEDMAHEQTYTAVDRVRMALELGPQYPHEIVENTGLASGTVTNAVTRLKKSLEVEPTGEKDGRAEQVRLVGKRGDDGPREGDNDDFWNIVDPDDEPF